jgi:hypothetical protein
MNNPGKEAISQKETRQNRSTAVGKNVATSIHFSEALHFMHKKEWKIIRNHQQLLSEYTDLSNSFIVGQSLARATNNFKREG